MDARFSEIITEDPYDVNVFLSAYNVAEYDGENLDAFYENRLYCAEYVDDEYYELSKEENLAYLQPYFDRTNVKLYSREEINERIAQREKELGITEETKNAGFIEWIACDLDLDEINGIKTVKVSTVEELLNAIDSYTTVVLAPGEYNVTDWINSQIAQGGLQGFYSYNPVTDDIEMAPYDGEPQIFYTGLEEEPGLLCRGFRYCTLRSEDPENPARIVSTPRGENVATFYDCFRLSLENLVFGHTDGNDECSGDVLGFDNCSRGNLFGCDLYGCGAVGIDLVNSYTFEFDHTVVHDCSVGGVFVSDSYGMDFVNSTFENIAGYGIVSMTSGGVTFTDCNFRGEESPLLGSWYDGYATFSDCVFDEVLWQELQNSPLLGDRVFTY